MSLLMSLLGIEPSAPTPKPKAGRVVRNLTGSSEDDVETDTAGSMRGKNPASHGNLKGVYKRTLAKRELRKDALVALAESQGRMMLVGEYADCSGFPRASTFAYLHALVRERRLCYIRLLNRAFAYGTADALKKYDGPRGNGESVVLEALALCAERGATRDELYAQLRPTLARGSLNHITISLETNQLVRVERDGKQKRYFPKGQENG